ncbi:YybH family protein [Actinomadura sp. 21ATH]|uniref:YybH family protein n=1 Tax=Actinomadura sp. 21ATH TaxID=1735444 RepID=UPI0035C030AA
MGPEELHRLMAARFTDGDLAGVMSLYEDGATYDAGRRGRLQGIDAIREHYRRLLALNLALELRTRKVVAMGEIALLACDWRLRGTGDDGKRVDRNGTAVEVARRQADGTWRYLIDEPAFLA